MDAPASRGAGQETGRVQQTELCHRLGRTHDGNPKGREGLNTACPNPAVHALHWPMRGCIVLSRRFEMPRGSWRGFLRLFLVSCPIYLSPATTRTKPIRLHQVWQPAPADVDED